MNFSNGRRNAESGNGKDGIAMAETSTSTNDYLSEIKRLLNEASTPCWSNTESERICRKTGGQHAEGNEPRVQHRLLDYINPYGVQSESLADAD